MLTSSRVGNPYRECGGKVGVQAVSRRVPKTWRAYSGYAPDVLASELVGRARRLGAYATIGAAPRRMAFSSSAGRLIQLRDGASIEVVPVEGDPIYRSLARVLSSGPRGLASLVIVRGRSGEQELLRALMGELARELREPAVWDLRAHVQLARSPWIRWETRRRWLTWI
jgi:hypothetical protein